MTSSGPSATSPRRTSTPTRRSWRGSWTSTRACTASRRRWWPASQWTCSAPADAKRRRAAARSWRSRSTCAMPGWGRCAARRSRCRASATWGRGRRASCM